MRAKQFTPLLLPKTRLPSPLPASDPDLGGIVNPWDDFDNKGTLISADNALRNPVLWTPGSVPFFIGASSPTPSGSLYQPATAYGTKGYLIRTTRSVVGAVYSGVGNDPYSPDMAALAAILDTAKLEKQAIILFNGGTGPLAYNMGVPAHSKDAVAFGPIPNVKLPLADPDRFVGGEMLCFLLNMSYAYSITTQPTGAVTNVDYSVTPNVVTLSAPIGVTAGTLLAVTISGISATGTPNGNGPQTVTIIDGTHFSLGGSTAHAITYNSGGTFVVTGGFTGFTTFTGVTAAANHDIDNLVACASSFSRARWVLYYYPSTFADVTNPDGGYAVGLETARSDQYAAFLSAINSLPNCTARVGPGSDTDDVIAADQVDEIKAFFSL